MYIIVVWSICFETIFLESKYLELDLTLISIQNVINMNSIDNSKLEELIKNMDMGLVKNEQKEEFFEEFRQSQLFMPVIMSSDFFESIEETEVGDTFITTETSGFDINYIDYGDGKKAVPLFTSCELMESTGLKSSAIAMFMSDLAPLLKESDGRYSMVSINPFTDFSIDMPTDTFISIFDNFTENEFLHSLNQVLDILKEKSVVLEKEYAFFVRDDVNFMKEEAIDGVFVPHVPFNVSSREDFRNDSTYLNILLMPKNKKILYLGEIAEDNQFDTVIAPESEFHFVKDVDEFTSIWRCGDQPFYD